MKIINKKEIPQGGLILEEKPFAYILCEKFRTVRCDFCFQKGQLLKCSVCRYTYYCGRACQREGWTVHKLECKYLKQISPRILPDSGRLLARLIKVLEKGGHNTKSYYTDIRFRTFKDLMSHYPNLKNDSTRMEHFSSLYAVLYEFFRGESLPNSAELMGMYGRICINSYSICNQELQSLGTGLYLAASVADHSCHPTAVVTFEGTTLIMRALKSFPNLDWSKIYISYIDVMATKKERLQELEQAYYFLCRCVKCINPEPIIEMTGAACPNSDCNNCFDSFTIKPDDECSACGTIISGEFIQLFQDVMDMTCMHLENMKETTFLDVCKVCLKKQKGILYKYNVKHIKTLDLAFDSSIEFGKFEEATEYGLQLIKSFYEYYGNVHPMVGLLHLKLAKLLLHQDCSEDALDHLKKAKDILKITHGMSSSIFKEHILPLYQDIMLEN
ncbi:histone-lysine N-methyltransferase SMYD3 isoform X1 [Diabrotica virgifera virgifera]|uniref:MYND-type domain-containing protein n=1 Tax=Diabrotica virgifera virgifera TaxID=50390 RepID=A0ABM5K7U5_DIAVI|nr:histone-lysine N-methyltransferase SMYD3 isoform X1 [Diabrotica virgifera virgifera]